MIQLAFCSKLTIETLTSIDWFLYDKNIVVNSNKFHLEPKRDKETTLPVPIPEEERKLT